MEIKCKKEDLIKSFNLNQGNVAAAHRYFLKTYNCPMCLSAFRNFLIKNNLIKARKNNKIIIE